MKQEDIDHILNIDNELYNSDRNYICYFFQLRPDQLYKELLEGYVEACEIMINIGIGSADDNIHSRLIKPLASAKRCYSYGEYLGCIELCALHGEMLANYLCISSKDILLKIIEKMSAEDSKIINEHIEANKKYISNSLGQTLRLRWLETGAIITSDDGKNFKKVHRLRTTYFHRWSTTIPNEKQDALDSLKCISIVSAKFLELTDFRHTNKDNLNRIKAYMEGVSD
ncbi:hypothetical protein [Legionella donaldsonii]|uniref:hypothetical protein n=1 Tax=Legionella donaldsonii TaxID=45060 RepID=UPI00399CEDFB